jgi:hypothetical protein
MIAFDDEYGPREKQTMCHFRTVFFIGHVECAHNNDGESNNN